MTILALEFSVFWEVKHPDSAVYPCVGSLFPTCTDEDEITHPAHNQAFFQQITYEYVKQLEVCTQNIEHAQKMATYEYERESRNRTFVGKHVAKISPATGTCTKLDSQWCLLTSEHLYQQTDADRRDLVQGFA